MANYLQEMNLKVIEHPPYSPCDFWLFPTLKEMLAGRHYELAIVFINETCTCTEYREAFRKLIERCKKVILFRESTLRV